MVSRWECSLDIYSQICDNVDELLQLGLDGLKAELQRIGLKCGGTAQVRREHIACATSSPDGTVRLVRTQERAERLFQTKGKRLLAELPPNIVAKARGCCALRLLQVPLSMETI